MDFNFNKVLNSQTKTIPFAAFLLGLSALISRLLGLFRDRLLASAFGAGETLDVYFTAFRIPDFVYGILITGGITAVFLPVFAEYFEKDKKEGWLLANNVLNCFFVLLVLVCLILSLFTPSLVEMIAPGFSLEKKNLTVSLTRFMFLSPILFGLSSIFSGILHYFNRFLAYSLAPILYNLGIIFGILFLSPYFGILGVVYGVIIGAFLHWLIQIPAALGSGFFYLPSFNFKHRGLKRIFKLMVPRTIGTAAYHINLIVITAIASTLISGSISIFNFSNNLQYLPIGIFGISFAVSSFPVLSQAWALNNKERFLEKLSQVFRQILFLIIPVSVLMFLLRAQIVRLILGTGQFGWLETRLTAASLGIFCLGIPAAALVPFLAWAFYSFQNTKTPVIIGLASMILSIILCFSFVKVLGFPNFFQDFMAKFLKIEGIENIEVIGLPLALSLASLFQFSLLFLGLIRKFGSLWIEKISYSFKKIIISTFFMGPFTFLTLRLLLPFVDMRTFLGVFFQTAGAAFAGILTYLSLAYFLKSPEIKTIESSILKKFTRKN